MIYQCTKAMLKALKTEPVPKPDIYNSLFSWNVKIMKIGRRNLVYLMNDLSKMSVVFYGVTAKELKDFDRLVMQGVEKVLEDFGVPVAIISQFAEQAGECIFTASGTRKQMGVLTLAAMETEYFFDEFMEDGLFQRRLCKHLNSRIVKNDNGDYVVPQKMTRNILETSFVGNVVPYDLGEIAINMYMADGMNMMAFLNKRDGSIKIAEKRTAEYESLDCNDDYIYIMKQYLDFFYEFGKFSREIRNIGFLRELELRGHGKGAVNRIRDLLCEYPDIRKQWHEHKDKVEKEGVRQWLESVGLM